MKVIESFVNERGERVIRHWERIKTSSSWFTVIINGVGAIMLLGLACIVLSLCWIFAQIRCFLAWLGWRWATLKLWVVKRGYE